MTNVSTPAEVEIDDPIGFIVKWGPGPSYLTSSGWYLEKNRAKMYSSSIEIISYLKAQYKYEYTTNQFEIIPIYKEL